MVTTQTQSWKKLTIVLSIVLSVLLLVANSGYWVNKYIFDAKNFSAITTESLTSKSSRAALADGIVARAFEGRPIAAKVLTEPVSNLVEGLLGTNFAEKAVHTVSERINIMVTSKEKKVVAFDLTGVKGVLEKLSNVAGEAAPDKLDVSQLPDRITIVDGNKLPNLYQYSVIMLWLTPITLLLSLVVLIVPYIRFRSSWRSILAIQGIAVMVSGALALAIGPLFKPIVLGSITETLPRTVIGNLYDSFIATFSNQSWQIIWLGVAVLIVAGIAYAYPYVVSAIKNRTQKSKPAK